MKPGHTVVLVDAPEGWAIDGLPDGVSVRRRSRTRTSSSRSVDVAIAFFRDLDTMQKSVVGLSRAITPDGALWLAWPRRAGGHTSDITDNGVRAAALPLGLVDVKVAALDDDWSAIKVVWRKELRAGLGG